MTRSIGALAAPFVACCLFAGGCGDSQDPLDEEVGQAEQAALSCVTLQEGGPSWVEDATIGYKASDPNSANLNDGNGIYLVSGAAPWLTKGRSLIKWDTSPIPAGATITSAIAKLKINGMGGGGILEAHRVLGPWSESTVTWNSFAATNSFDPTILTSVTAVGPTTLTLDLMGIVPQWVSGSLVNDGLLFKLTNESGLVRAGSSEASTGLRPTLEVCYLFGGAVCGDSLLQAPEECDDGNTVSGDGCSSNCLIETLAPEDECPGVTLALSPAGAGSESASVAGDTTGLFHDVSGSCGGGSGADAIYVVTPSYTGSMTVSLNAAFDTLLYVGTSCGGSDQGCSNNPGLGNESIQLPVVAGTAYTVVVDTAAGGPGTFTLTATVNAALCGNGVLDSGEECDDGNGVSGDGCSATCTIDKGWGPGGTMSYYRVASHSVTRLLDGRVLVAGGYSYLPSLVTDPYAEIYDPATRQWTVVAPMATARAYHSAHLLADGRVMVVGGYAAAGATTSTEIYDPVSDTWSAGPPATFTHAGAAATTLADGRPLVVGGCCGGFQGTGEVFNPASNTWTTLPVFGFDHAGATAVLLGNGKVIFAGGGGVPPYTATAELFDPTTWTITPTGSLLLARVPGPGTLLQDGRVLYAGGTSTGYPTYTTVTNAEVYNPASGTFSAVASMPVARGGHTATRLLDGRVLIANGNGYLASSYIYNPVANTWTFSGNSAAGRIASVATLLPAGEVLVVGGYVSAGPDINEIYHP